MHPETPKSVNSRQNPKYMPAERGSRGSSVVHNQGMGGEGRAVKNREITYCRVEEEIGQTGNLGAPRAEVHTSNRHICIHGHDKCWLNTIISPDVKSLQKYSLKTKQGPGGSGKDRTGLGPARLNISAKRWNKRTGQSQR